MLFAPRDTPLRGKTDLHTNQNPPPPTHNKTQQQQRSNTHKVLLLPPSPLAICAGAIFGLPLGTLCSWLPALIGESVAFLLGRFLLRGWVRALTAAWPTWRALEAALREDGWKLVALLRLSPAVPFSVLNYALGTSSLKVY
jgi:uncharacterized membrane protein YdjX (TVP38/TMEM64 family)